ncbi:thiamine pyrophosphate-binding protein [Rhodococcus sp. BP-241]|uniref:thiamine pyrophosphate-binding protein n=1 Tax=Rhodococcus sp. BP-241 TaxID=2739441 RepID=UPI001C9B0484|nr:thiamine pyrophosphate-binding protein [Rhodococcus sp. BP-241]MBY6708651.1 thiamine pyrophosphate-binding protein [Rhodococcus sp. BP-241]
MTSATGSELVVRGLLDAGVSVLFSLNGAHVDGIFQAALDQDLDIVDVRHEMNAGHAAEGYARVTGEMGAAVVTAGGGFTNVLTSITNAHLDRTPMLYITGSGPLATDLVNDQQAGFDQVAMAAPVTKFAHRVTRADLIPRVLAQAIRTAESTPRGPVLLDIPWDVLRQSVETTDTQNYRTVIDGYGCAPNDVSDRILDALSTARRPVALVGNAFGSRESRAQLHDFASRAGIPLVSDYEGLGALTGSDWHVGLVQSLATLAPDDRPDMVLVLGVRFGLPTRFATGQLIPGDARVFQIDPDGRELGRLQNVEVGIQADPVATVAHFGDRLGVGAAPAQRKAWLARLKQATDEHTASLQAEAEAHTGAIHPFLAVRTIAMTVPDESVIVVDGALTELWLSETIASANVSHFLGHGYLSSMGCQMGTALGAQYANRERATVLVTGDGAVGYSLAEFDSMVRAGLPVVVIVLNNQAWGATLHTQEWLFGTDRVTHNRLPNGSYSAVARALGADGIDVDTLSELRPAIESALRSRRPTCIDVRVSLDPIPPEERSLMGGGPFTTVTTSST